jgi:hypothetical protein
MATRNRYAEIMAQYAQTQPFSFFGYPSTYSGGYDVPQPQAYAAPVSRYEEIMSQPAMGGGGGRGMPEAPSAWSQMTPAERAAYYAANPIQGSIALGMQDLFGNATLLGNAAKYFGADGWYDSRLEKQGYDPKQFAYGPPDLRGGFVSAAPALSTDSGVTYSTGTGDFSSQYGPDQYGPGISAGETLNRQMAQDRADSAGGERGYSGDNSGDNAGWGSRDAGGDGGYAKGGHVSMQRLQGPNPAGPDDGYAALKDGEYVINDKAVKKYGIELMEAINLGKISKGKLRGLLEM